MLAGLAESRLHQRMTEPTLLHFRVSHYNEKVRWALDYKQWPHRRRTLVPAFHIPTARRATGQNKVPVLELDGQFLADSSRIIAELELRRPDPPLFPSEATERARALEIAEFYDNQVAPDLRRLFWSTYFPHPIAAARLATDGFGALTRTVWLCMFPLLRVAMRANMGASRKRVQEAHERLAGYFDRLESEIRPSGYLVGDAFSIADLTAAAVMTAIVRPPQFSYPLPEPRPPEFVALRASVEQRAGFRWVLDIYERHRGRSAEIAD
jgi:glutathione S-transferase